ncbi:hypothetical protein KKJ09_14295 [Xenorhabdus bovienii]|nr:hypothetical protein [Xenorhabdus bovienii]MDE9494718.1 hypothetical protein [Xenorhabdus bovienii]MDE9503075.1 hypothetical protein [Xenorhabdus bovienii]
MPYYSDRINFLPCSDALQGEVRFLSARDMYDACDAFLAVTTCHIEHRWLPSKEHRKHLAQQLKSYMPPDWKPYGEWKGLVQHALDIAYQHAPRFRISEWDERDIRAELLTNIHISARATRKTVELFDCGDPKLLPVGTNVFAVSAQLNEFLASVIAGAVNPVWMATVDSEWTPGCRNGIHPQYSPRKV